MPVMLGSSDESRNLHFRDKKQHLLSTTGVSTPRHLGVYRVIVAAATMASVRTMYVCHREEELSVYSCDISRRNTDNNPGVPQIASSVIYKYNLPTCQTRTRIIAGGQTMIASHASRDVTMPILDLHLSSSAVLTGA